ncbi:MAG: DUF4198 domain-containing protein [Pirellulaceae bacterium]|nr:DUF4198 domain-containing protein [Pirellulaceae bacterium]
MTNTTTYVRPTLFVLSTLALFFCAVPLLRAHFIWIEVADQKAYAYFGEGPDPSTTEMANYLEKLTLHQYTVDGKKSPVALSLHEAAYRSQKKITEPTVLGGSMDWGLFDRAQTKFHLIYHAKHIAAKTETKEEKETFAKLAAATDLPLEIIPKFDGKDIVFHITYQKKPLSGATIDLITPELENRSLKTDDQGNATLAVDQEGLWALRTMTAVTLDENDPRAKEAQEVRHYTTLTLNLTK